MPLWVLESVLPKVTLPYGRLHMLHDQRKNLDRIEMIYRIEGEHPDLCFYLVNPVNPV